MIESLMFARVFHVFYYFVALGRDMYPDWLSVNMGNTLLFVGFYFEAHVMLKMIAEENETTNDLLKFLLFSSIILFNVIEFLFPVGGIRIAVASLCVIALMVFPCVRMLMSRDTSPFAKSTAIMYCVFLVLLLPRAWHSLVNPETTILTSNTVQGLAFLSLYLLLLISQPAYFMIIKEHTDDALILMAASDKLTGVTNRHAFLDAATAVFGNSKKLHVSQAILYVDIDYFRHVNDTYGFAFGDVVLTRLASIIDQCLRDSDLSCRYGSGEFVALLYRADYKTAQVIAEQVIQQVRTAQFAEYPEFQFTVSIGISCGIPYSWQSLEDVINNAGGAVRDAKEKGRDCTVFHTSLDRV
ncbi:GGDEF domain-containing protein [Lachnospiraceae bacterium OttesenSCG-928-D06]|nr:GGDEF domain-containing protein [Lachnospiraceae bacterium OttesenSCG-928-D06]